MELLLNDRSTSSRQDADFQLLRLLKKPQLLLGLEHALLGLRQAANLHVDSVTGYKCCLHEELDIDNAAKLFSSVEIAHILFQLAGRPLGQRVWVTAYFYG